MKVRDVMTTAVVTTTPETPLKVAAESLTTHGISGLPVLADDGAVVGVLSASDLLAKQQRPVLNHRRGRWSSRAG